MFAVRWSRTAMHDLAEAWVEAPPGVRMQITAAVADIDRLLRSRPEQLGESRGEDERLAFIGPLAVRFQIDARHRRVLVEKVLALPRRQ